MENTPAPQPPINYDYAGSTPPDSANSQNQISPNPPNQNPQNSPISPTPISPTSLNLSSPSPKKSHIGLVVGLIAGGLILLAIVATILFIFVWQKDFRDSGYSWVEPRRAPMTDADIRDLEEQYGYDLTYRPDVSPTENFTFAASDAVGECLDTTCTDAFAVYSDAALTHRTAANIYESATGEITVAPTTEKAEDYSSPDANGWNSNYARLNITSGQRWSLAETYFLVQRLDSNGEKLARPKVILFTVKPDAKVLAATDVRVKVDDNGAFNLSWNRVYGAKQYYVVVVQYGAGESPADDDDWHPYGLNDF